jgi:uncharacterized protein YkwD
MPVFVPGEPAEETTPRGASSRASSGPRVPPRTMGDTALRRAIFDEVNLARRAMGAAALIDDANLMAAAADYSIELARMGRLSHESPTPDRRTLAERLAAAGASNWSRAGENLAKIHGPDFELAEAVTKGWLDSPGHRRNLLEREYTLAGVGVARAADGYWYVTQVYARPLPRAAR